jgi:hypothetical protein
MPYNEFVAIHTQFSSELTLWSATWLQVVGTALASQGPQGYFVIPIVGPDVTRKSQFTLVVCDSDVVLIDGIGHGDDNDFFAYNLAEVLYGNAVGGVPENEVKGKFVHFLSCSTANGLDQTFIQSQCAVFIGYTKVVPFGNSNAENINIATADAQIDIWLAKGKTVAYAIDQAKSAYQNCGRGDIGETLVSNPPNCSLQLPGVAGGVQPLGLAQHQIPSRSLAPSNAIGTNNV